MKGKSKAVVLPPPLFPPLFIVLDSNLTITPLHAGLTKPFEDQYSEKGSNNNNKMNISYRHVA